jgi:hypothetical protein
VRANLERSASYRPPAPHRESEFPPEKETGRLQDWPSSARRDSRLEHSEPHCPGREIDPPWRVLQCFQLADSRSAETEHLFQEMETAPRQEERLQPAQRASNRQAQAAGTQAASPWDREQSESSDSVGPRTGPPSAEAVAAHIVAPNIPPKQAAAEPKRVDTCGLSSPKFYSATLVPRVAARHTSDSRADLL